MHKLPKTLSLFLLAALLLVGRSSLIAQGPPQPTSLAISAPDGIPPVVPQGECYTITVGGGANMTLDTYYSSDHAGSGVLTGWPALDAAGQREICTDSGTPLGYYHFQQIRNTLNTDWVNLLQGTLYPRVVVVGPLPQPTGMSFDQSYGFAGNDSYTLTIADGANMSVDVSFTLNGTPFIGTITTDSAGQYFYNLEQDIWTGEIIFTALKNAGSRHWVTLPQPVYYTIYPPHPTSLSLSPTTKQAGGGPFQITVGNGAGITLESRVAFNGVEMNPSPFKQVALVPQSSGSAIGVANVDVGTCVLPGQYTFLKIRNYANGSLHAWEELSNKTLTVTALTPGLGPPSVSDQSVTSAARGASGTITITGSNLCNVALQTSWPGLSFGAIPSFHGPNQVSTTYQVAAGAQLGAALVTLSALGGNTTLDFTITPAAPAITGISPSLGYQGASVGITLTGTNLDGGTLAANPAWPGLNISDVSVNAQGTSLTATFSMAANANPGSPNLRVTTSNGNATTTAFQIVTPPSPTITGISPSSGIRGTSVPVTIIGTNLYGPVLTTTWSDLSITNQVPHANGTSMTATLVILSSAPLGNPQIQVETPGGNAATTAFTVLPIPSPTISSISPSSGVPGSIVSVEMTGAGLLNPALSTAWSNLTFSDLVAAGNGTGLTAKFHIGAGAPTGISIPITVTAAGGETSMSLFSIVSPGVTLVQWKKDYIHDDGGQVIAVATPQPPDTQAPSVPTGVGGPPAASTFVIVTWVSSNDPPQTNPAVGASGIGGYRIYRQRNSEASLPIAVVGSSVSAYTDSTVEPGTQYTFRIVAVDRAGNASAPSAGFTVTTP